MEDKMESKMISDIKEMIRERCESPNNFFGIGIYQFGKAQDATEPDPHAFIIYKDSLEVQIEE